VTNTDCLQAFTLFSVLFECVSAYGTVGLSLGYPGLNTSFSGEFHVLSKLVIIAMQIRGRHRGLPYALDKAILLPSEGLQKKEAAAAAAARRRRGSTLDTMDTGGVGANFTSALGTPTPAVGPGGRRMSRASTAPSTLNGQSHPEGHGLTRLLTQVLSAGPASVANKLKQ